MSTILIQDLAESIELDQEAMSVIYGGAFSARSSQRGKLELQTKLSTKRTTRLLDLARENQRRIRL